jgi:hypothetical protein
MGGEGMQAGMQEGIMQMAPQEMQPQMQQMDAEQYRPVAEQLAQDPNQALMAIVRMLMEQGIPEEEAIKIAKQMIQAVAEGGIEEVSDDTRVEARFGGRIGYAGGGISNVAIARETLQSRAPEGEFLAYINPEEAGILKALGGAGQDINATGVPSFFVKKVFKAAKSVVKGAANAVKSVAKSPIGRIALTIAAGYYLGPAGLNIGSGMGAITGGALRAGIANLAVQAASGQKINFGEALTSAALGGVTGGLTQGQTGVTGTESMGAGGVQLNPLYNDLQYTPMDSVTSMGAGGVDMNAVYNDMGYTPSNITPSGVNMSSVYNDLTPAKTSSGIMDTLKSSGTKIFDVAKDYGTQALDFAKNNKLLTAGTLAAGASLLSPEIPEQLPGESMEEYNARVAEFQNQYASNLAGRTGPSLPAGARNPFYPVYAARGGRIGFEGGGIGNIIKQVTQQSFFNQPNMPMMANGGRMRYAMGNSVEEGIMAAPQIASQMGMPVGNPRMNEGGVPELDYRDEGGFVPPIGIKERADDIPAMLSNNEFVFTADAVKNAGGGDPNVGAQKMYTLMKRLESGGRV